MHGRNPLESLLSLSIHFRFASAHHLDFFETGGVVTLRAVRTETALVYIVTCMTVVAGRRCHNLLVDRSCMTGQTIKALMPAIQLEMRARVVFEIPGLPAVGVVARRTVLAEPGLVGIVFAVAGRAVRLRIFIGRAGMAVLARGCGMRTEQGEARQVMLELHLLAPTAFIVAALAIAPFLATMNIVGLVAGKTGSLDLLGAHRAGMAGLASRFGMQSTQRVLGIAVMIEGGLRPFAAAVAALAIRPVTALMHVVARMTVFARRRQFLF